MTAEVSYWLSKPDRRLLTRAATTTRLTSGTGGRQDHLPKALASVDYTMDCGHDHDLRQGLIRPESRRLGRPHDGAVAAAVSCSSTQLRWRRAGPVAVHPSPIGAEGSGNVYELKISIGGYDDTAGEGATVADGRSDIGTVERAASDRCELCSRRQCLQAPEGWQTLGDPVGVGEFASGQASSSFQYRDGGAVTVEMADHITAPDRTAVLDHREGAADVEPISLRSERRSDKKDQFNWRVYLPDEFIEGKGAGIRADDYVQVSFSHGQSSKKEESTQTRYRDELPFPALYLTPVPDGVDPSTVPSSRKVRTGTRVSESVQLPPKLITGANGLGLDADGYSHDENRLLFQPIVHGKSLALVPIGFEDGADFEVPRPESEPELKTRPTDALISGAELVIDPEKTANRVDQVGRRTLKLAGQARTPDNPDSAYKYYVYLRDLINNVEEFDLESGDYVEVALDPGEDGLGPSLVLAKFPDDQDPSKAPHARKISSPRDGMAVAIPPRLVRGEGDHGLGLSEEWYRPQENALLFEPVWMETAVMLDPIGFEDGTPYPREAPTRQEDIEDDEVPPHLADGLYVDQTPILIDIVTELARSTPLSATDIATGLQQIQETVDRAAITESETLQEDYLLLNTPEKGLRTRVQFFTDETAWDDTVFPQIAADYDQEALEVLREVLPRAHGIQAEQLVDEIGANGQNGADNERSAVVLVSSHESGS